MTYLGQQFLYLSNVFGNASEVINGARTARRLIESEGCGGGTFSSVLDNAGCDALLLRPCTMATDGTVDDWTVAQLIPETAPWYNGTDASVEAYGFYIEEWSGLDGAHHVKSVTGVGMNRGGAIFGPQSHNHRTMKLNVLLCASSERGITYLFRWLEQTLLRSCGGCEGHDLWVREICPTDPVTSPKEGLARMRKVELLEGPTWEAPISDYAGCELRRASFTLGAGDPCMYGDKIACTAATTLPVVTGAPAPESFTDTRVAPDGSWLAYGYGVSCRASFTGVPYGSLAPRVTVSSPIEAPAAERRALPDLRISGYTDPASSGVFGPASDMRKIGEFILTGRGTTGLEIVVDLAEREVRYREEAGSSFEGWLDGSRLIGRAVEPGVPRWWDFDFCDEGVLIVEPVYGSRYNLAQATASTAAAFTVAVDMVPRWGCV